ncbi:YcaO-like family protein [Vibrio gallaecicus]|uniref:YcaO-like family protein n=1 Tax=Vibrio gallaecicus TaxID=552386 RepID=UPI0010C96FA7|nr:YcaO-like family protein [Vibrio gallaecicus]MDN3616786.1 YcaO-like family protein [Vibrio gallaecicus]
MSYKRHQKGTHRLCSPQSTFDKISPFFKEMGITRVANITGLDRIGIPVVTVCRPDSCAISVAQGKGLDLMSAKVSGAMEAIETYHAEHIDLPLKLASYSQLSNKYSVLNVDGLPKLAFSQFSPHEQRLWVEGIELFTQQATYVPYEVVHCNYTLPLPTGSGAFAMSSNGLASGNSMDEAIVHGLCEAIERDALALWKVEQRYSNHPETNQLDLKTIDDEDCLEVINQYYQAGVNVQVWDITTDIELPSFYCRIVSETSQNSDQGPSYPAFGSGTHPCKSIALLRALTEAAQTRLTMISGSRDDINANAYQRLDSEKEKGTPLNPPPHLLRNFNDIQSWSNQCFKEDIKLITSKLKQVNLAQAAFVNLEKSEFQIPVVRVVVPGLEGIDELPGYQMGTRALAIKALASSGEQA